ncbi:ATP-dependent DNA ligase [Kibdelosporangium lantanae]
MGQDAGVLTPPVKPMLAKAAGTIPDGADLIFEPKWDGFRCLVFRDGAEVTLQSRSTKPLNRYFPEVVARLVAGLPDKVVLDGELVVGRDGRLDFDALSERIHPAASRVNLLAEQTPATFVAFDVLQLPSGPVLESPGGERRDMLVNLVADTDAVSLTPATRDVELARQWFTLFEGAGLDGVIGKPADGPYTPDKRSMLKFKHSRTADCVVAGLRWYKDTEPGTAVGSLLLGLYDSNGVLHSVGVVGSFPAERRRELAVELAPLMAGGEEGHPWLGEVAAGTRVPGRSTGGAVPRRPGFPCGGSLSSRWRTSTPRVGIRAGSGTPPSSSGGGRTGSLPRAGTSSWRSPRGTTSTRC